MNKNGWLLGDWWDGYYWYHFYNPDTDEYTDGFKFDMYGMASFIGKVCTYKEREYYYPPISDEHDYVLPREYIF